MGHTGKGKMFSCFIPPHRFMQLAVSGMMRDVEFTGQLHLSVTSCTEMIQDDSK
jgi:hypothetical protein